MGNVKRNIVIVLVSGIVSLQLSAQTSDLSGVWVLKKKQSLSGSDYINGIPKKMKVSVTADSMIMERLYDGGTKDDYTMTDAFALNGNATSVLISNRRRQSVLNPGSDENRFSIKITYTDTATGKTNSAFVENWKVNLHDSELVIVKNARGIDGNNWSMEGAYGLTTAKQLQEQLAVGKGIEFAKSLNWNGIRDLAKKESKFIFVDCFASWCLPCKKMEKEIFPLNMVGAEMNDHFISLRLQMDTTKKDDESVRSWYATAHEFMTKYHLVGYPTFLFFDADGNVVHKGLGTYKADEFIGLLKAARDPNEQFYTLLESYKRKKTGNDQLYHLVLESKKLDELNLAEAVLTEYKSNWLDKLPPDSLLSEKYLKLAYDFPQLLIRQNGSKGSFFKLMYKNGKDVDQILHLPGFSAFHVNGIITREEIEDKIYRNEKPFASPQWDKIDVAIKRKYIKVDADRLILDAQLNYYKQNKDWNNQIKCLVKKVDKYGPLSLANADGSGSDNVIADVLLPHCDDKIILTKAVGWIEQILQSNIYRYPIPMVYGNYGGLLYKSGKKEAGIGAFEKHLDVISKGATNIDNNPRLKSKIDILNKMKRGEKIDSNWNIEAFF